MKNDLHDVVFPEVSVVAIAVICAQSPQEGCALFLLGNLLQGDQVAQTVQELDVTKGPELVLQHYFLLVRLTLPNVDHTDFVRLVTLRKEYIFTQNQHELLEFRHSDVIVKALTHESCRGS